MAQNTIGQYNFAVIQGVPEILTSPIEVIERPNVDGTALRGLGRRGREFACRTITDCESLTAGRWDLENYELLVGADPVPIVVNDVDYFMIQGILVAVLAVTPIRLQKASTITGGLNYSTGAVLYTGWRLKVIEV